MATWDTVLRASKPVYVHDAVTLVEGAVTCPGGKGVVTAIAAHHGGAQVVPCSLVGRRSTIAAQLAPVFTTDHLLPALEEDHRIWIISSGAHEVVTFARWVASDVDSSGIDTAAAMFIREIDLLYISMEHPALVDAALRYATAAELPIVSNLCAPLIALCRPSLPGIVRCSGTAICNESEAADALAALGVESWGSADAPELQEVVVTAGAAGGRWSRRPFEHWTSYSPIPTEPVCVVGAGDTFNGQFLVSRFIEGQPADEACHAAAHRAAEKVATFGSSLPISGLFGRLRGDV